jgi:hypothetical protein
VLLLLLLFPLHLLVFIAGDKMKPWLKQPGELHDLKGYPIYPGDLLRTFHYYGPRRKRNYLYHTVVYRDGGLRMVPTEHLEPTKVKGGGDCLLSEDFAQHVEIISGYGPHKDHLDYTDRPRKKS